MMKVLINCFKGILLIAILTSEVNGQVYQQDEPFAHTFSVIAIDTVAGEMAVGVQSHWFSVGSIVSWAKSGVGVVATQSFVNPALGTDGLKLMEQGVSAKEALKNLIDADNGRDYRQVAMLDKSGSIFAYTGKKCVAAASHMVGKNYSVQANMMLNDKVVPAMTQAFEENSELPLAERLVKTMLAAQEAGGDIRGRQSAVLLVVNTEPVENEWMDKKIDLRVDDNSNPLQELERLLKVHRAYEHMNKGDLAIEHNNMELALEEYEQAEKMFPENLEMKYWKAIALANNGRLDEALPIFKNIFEQDQNWLELTKRLPKSGLLNLSEDEYKQIIEL